MPTNKKSLEWLKPLELTAKEAKVFRDAVAKEPSEEVLEKQVKLFEVAKRLK